MALTPDPVAAPETEPPPQPIPVYTGPGWTLAQRLAFRFVFVYLILYLLPFPIATLDSLLTNLREIVTGEESEPDQPSLISRYVTKPYRDFWDEVVLWTGREVFGVEIEYRSYGRGDKTWNYVQLFDFAVISVALTLLWTVATWAWGRRGRPPRVGYPHLHEWLRVYVRFYLAEKMIVYGGFKVIQLQFPYPDPDTLLHTYGESSPMHLLWTFMGASDGYNWFTGAGEIVGGLLLCTRRTTLLGALVTFAVMVNVAALNFCYDVPVKLLSSHLVLMSLFLMAPDLPWLVRVFVLGRPEARRGYTPLVRRPWLNRILSVVRTLVVLLFVGVTLYNNYEMSKLYGPLVPEPPLFGLWEVEEFSLDEKVRPPLTTDAGRWQRVTFNKAFTFRKSSPGKPQVRITNMRGQYILIAEVEVDEEKKTITLTRPGDPPGSTTPPIVHVLRYREVEPEVIEVEGKVALFADGKFGPKQVKVRLRHYGKDKFLLSNRGFHWINEMPYDQYGLRSEPPPKIAPPPKRP
jgi:uncharacterized membrane protein YphA (DoxX/SURF4 family)